MGALGSGEACIRSEGWWFAPPAFEDFGGKGSAKKWKASIFYEEKPLQFWLEQGYITTKGYKKRGAKAKKPKKVSSSDSEEEELSEEASTQSPEDTEENDVEDEDVAGNHTDSSGTKERTIKSIILTAENSRFHKTPKVILRRLSESKIKQIIRHTEQLSPTSSCTLSEAESDHKTNPSKDPVEDSCCDPLDEFEHREEERESNALPTDHLSIAAAPDVDPSLMSDPPFDGGIKKENGKELMESEDRTDDQRVIKMETLPYTPGTSSPGIKREAENAGFTNSPTALLTSSPVSIVADAAGFAEYMKDGLENKEELEIRHCGTKEKEWKSKEHLDMPKSEDSGQTCATGNRDMTSNKVPDQEGTEEEITEPMSPFIKPLSVLECFSLHGISGPRDVTSSDHNAAQSQMMKLKTSIPQTTQPLDCAYCSNMMKAPLSRVTESSNVDTMELDQLRREKLKMQVKVLRLQEEYYTLKIKELKK